MSEKDKEKKKLQIFFMRSSKFWQKPPPKTLFFSEREILVHKGSTMKQNLGITIGEKIKFYSNTFQTAMNRTI